MGSRNAIVDELKNYFKTHGKILEHKAHNSKVQTHTMGWSCDGRRLASGSFDKTVAVFMLERASLRKENTYRGHSDSVDQLCWHPTNANLLTTASVDKTVRIWDIRSGKRSSVIKTKGENIHIAWSPDGKTIAVGNKNDLVAFIDTRMNKIRSIEQYNFEVNEIAWNNSGDLFFLTNGLGCIHILSYPSLKLQHILRAHTASCICIEFDPTGKYFATGSADALVSLWDANELACLRVLSCLEWPVRTISFSHDAKLIASASEDLLIDIAHTETGKKIADVAVDGATFKVAWHPKQYLLAFVCKDRNSNDWHRKAGNLKVFGFQE